MPKYKNSDIAQLGHQLTLSPRRQRLSQMSGAERLLEIIDSEKSYPYDFVCYHLTGYRPLKPSRRPALKGESLISDLVRLIEHLSQSVSITLAVIREPVQTQDELSKRLSVSTKTIARWRQRGLSGMRVLDSDRVSRLVFTERALQRFVSRNRELVVRGGAFRQLSQSERDTIIMRANELVADKRLKLQEVSRLIAEETSRAVETIRYTLKRHDEQDPENALFGPSGRPRIPDVYRKIHQACSNGVSVDRVAAQHGLSRRQVEKISTEMRAYALINRQLSFVFNPEFEMADAHSIILDAAEPKPANGKQSKAPNDAPAYLKSLYRVPLLTSAQERDLFRRYNYCKYKAHAAIQQLDPCKAGKRKLADIEKALSEADVYQNRIIKANLRLVVSIAQRHLGSGANMFELISDGNMSLMRAVERFDYARGFKFSTYASWAIIKNFARTIPEERGRYARYVTGQEEILSAAPDGNETHASQPTEAEGVRSAIQRALAQLEERERIILTSHFGLNCDKGEGSTLEQLGARFGVTKERIRQIEKRALEKLKQILPSSLADFTTSS